MRHITVFMSLVLAAPAAAQSTSPAVFIVNNVSDEITSFTMNPDGTLNLIGLFPTSDGPLDAAISPNGRHLAVTHGTSSSTTEVFQIFVVNPDASLTMVLDTVVPDAALGTVWLNDDVVAVTETDLGGPNFAHTYAFDPGGPSFTLVDSGATGAFNTDLAIHPGLPVLYAQDSTNNTITWFEYDAAGNLTTGGVVGTGGLFPLRLAILNDASMLYAAAGISGGSDKVVGMRLDGAGAPTLHPESPFTSPGNSPAYLTVSSDDRFLFVGHGADATIHSFEIDNDGTITPTGFMFDIGSQGTLGDIEVLGNYLVATDEATFARGVRGIYSFEIHPDGNFTPVAPIYDPGGARPETIVVWQPSRPADVNGDGVVNVFDLLAVLDAWGPCPTPCPEDVNGDGVVNVFDLLAVLGDWG